MKKEYEEIVWNLKNNMIKVPRAISGLGAASACTSSYVSAYRDFEIIISFEYQILNYLEQVVFYEELKKKKEIWDGEEHGSILAEYKTGMHKKIEELEEWISERTLQNWQ